MMQGNDVGNDLVISFNAMLMEDVSRAIDRYHSNNDQIHKRQLIRSIFSLIEGNIWSYKENIKSIARDLELIDEATLLLFEEKEYQVSDSGELFTKNSYMPTKTMFRFASKTAQKIDPNLAINFGDGGWESLINAYKIRDRITHPKTKSDLVVHDTDMSVVWEGCLWAIANINSSLDHSTNAYKNYLNDLKTIFQKLKDEDPEYLELYEKAKRL